MEGLSQPLLFAPVYKDYLWGGARIAQRFERTGTPQICAESWEISAHPDGPSVVRTGPFEGESLAVLTARFGRALLGARAPREDRFPLLFKIIDARQKLSLQVHPSEHTSAACGGEPKTELWVLLDCTPGAALFAGLQTGTDDRSLRAALAAGSAEGHLVRHPVNPGDALFIPGGLVHAIGDGCLLYEIQQNANTTYRLYDWGRLGPDGKPRTLHLNQAFAAIDWNLPVPAVSSVAASVPGAAQAWSDVCACPFFRVRRLRLTTPETVRPDGGSFHVLFVASGRVTVDAGGREAEWPAGTSALVAASSPPYRLAPRGGPAEILFSTL